MNSRDIRLKKEKLIRWDERFDIILQEVLDLNYFLDLFRETQKVIEWNSELREIKSHFWRSYNYAFISLLLAQTRKQLKKWSTISLRSLLEEIHTYPQFITRSDFQKRFTSINEANLKEAPQYIRDAERKRAYTKSSSTFSKLCWAWGFMDVAIVAEDIDSLVSNFQELETFCDKMLLHRDVWELSNEHKTWDFEKLKTHIDILSGLISKYYIILTCKGIDMHVELGEEWKDIFKIPWIS